MTLPKSIGVIGAGHLSKHLVEGWARLGDGMPDVVLSPRNAAVAADLAERFGCAVAESNAHVVEACEVAILSVRPWQAEEALSGLPWRKDQTAISVMAAIATDDLAALVVPARVVRSMPIIAARYAESPTTIFPDDETARAVMAPLGPVIALPREGLFNAAAVHGTTFGWAIALIEEVTAWTREQGLPEDMSRALVAQTFRAAATMARDAEEPLHEIIADLCSPGSYTGFGLEHLKEKKAFDPWIEAEQRILERYESGD